MTDTYQIISNAKLLLEENISELQIDLYPDNPTDFKLEHSIGAALVSYQGNSYSEPFGRNQSALHSIGVTVCCHNYISTQDRLSYIDRIRQTLSNPLSQMYLVGMQPPVLEDNVWYYELNFMLPQQVVWGE